jgi:hypothetical protein
MPLSNALQNVGLNSALHSDPLPAAQVNTLYTQPAGQISPVLRNALILVRRNQYDGHDQVVFGQLTASLHGVSVNDSVVIADVSCAWIDASTIGAPHQRRHVFSRSVRSAVTAKVGRCKRRRTGACHQLKLLFVHCH